MILMKEYVSLTTAAMEMGKRHFYQKSLNQTSHTFTLASLKYKK